MKHETSGIRVTRAGLRSRDAIGFASSAAMWQFEREMRALGFERVAGVDEAGRGPLAGPIVAAAVVLAHPVDGLNDSKLLTESQREALFAKLAAGGHSIGYAVIDAAEIDRRGIQSANYGAMMAAVQKLNPAPDYLLVDGFTIRGCPLPQLRIVKGDRRSQSVAAASIIAKVTRDRIMCELDRTYPGYGFARHKGYATEEHLATLQALGPCAIHRKTFAPLSDAKVTKELF